MRQIVLDTETTGLSPSQGHRIIEIGCVEVKQRRITGERFHCYLNPERAVDYGAFRVHGLSDEFLSEKPLFNRVVDEFLDFITGAELIIHNAPFDVGFLDHELNLLAARYGNVNRYCSVFDTLTYARQLHPGQKNSLDALCKRYSIENSHRQLHGALLDAEILARVYLAMTSGQESFFDKSQSESVAADLKSPTHDFSALDTPVVSATTAENEAHEAYFKTET
jgi:DNA polymerase III subunit epsilon